MHFKHISTKLQNINLIKKYLTHKTPLELFIKWGFVKKLNQTDYIIE